jgi:hypothetical protein
VTKALKIFGMVFLGLWMIWVSKELIDIKEIAIEACGIAAVHGTDNNGGIHLPVICPDLTSDEAKRQTPH